ncbi:hypothetical protein F5B20DRAFT_577402 [Whalleya microplaca]|nr:hypothetical protein F5B20DRAFT_577402 [Whalleya microplaca]
MDEKSSQSSYGTGIQSSPETLPRAESSEVTSASSASVDNSIADVNKEVVEDSPETMEPPKDSSEDADKGSQQLASDNVEERDKSDGPLADSDSESDASSIDESLFTAYKTKMGEKAQKKGRNNQDSNLVNGLVDYLRVMESRMSKLEAGMPNDSDKEVAADDNAGSNSDNVAKQDSDSDNSKDKPSFEGDKSVEVSVKFFNAAAYLDKDGSYPTVSGETEKGTFVCGHDTQHLIRVLYSKVPNDNTKPQKEADSEPPNAASIDIMTFGVLSEAISAFFAKQLDIDADSDNVIRFGKPFRPLLRHLGSAREQLKKLETAYGSVWTNDVDKSRTAKESQRETPNTITNRNESEALPFKTTDHSENDDIQAFDRPTALTHFKAFLDFVDEYLGNQIQLYERLREGKEHQISFENLWMLFDVNDTIFCPLREVGTEVLYNSDGSDHAPIRRYVPQAYRVVATSGGMPFTRTLAPALTAKGVDNPTFPISFNNPILAPGPETGQQVVSEIFLQSIPISRRVRNSYTELCVYCFYIDFDGVEYGMVSEVFIFKPFEKEVDIRSLQAYPTRYMLVDTLHDRGKAFLDATRISHMQYEGLTVGPNREEINSPVVVDLKLAFEGESDSKKASIEVPTFKSPTTLWLPNTDGEACNLFGGSSCSQRWCWGCKSDAYVDSQRKQREKIDSEIKLVLEEYENEKQRYEEELGQFRQLMENKGIIRLLPGTVPGFALRNRKWVLLNLKQLGPVQQNNEWDKLVLPSGHREMVQAMVETHTQELGSKKDSNVGMDLVQGKGRGCIILLHGVPGVGKTSTAECVAAHTKKPLYPITCGDIGYSPEDVERNMENHFKLAHKWGCVLLLDEADVFLAKRDQKDIQRNGLVSVFLRILEYYSGILFLTTNRVGAIDDAFRSRLHLTLYYPKLTMKQTQKIFKMNFERIAEINTQREKNGLAKFACKDTEKKKIMDWSKKRWTKLRWNGRQIRNTFQTVLALSEFNARVRNSESPDLAVTKKHFNIVANASIQFDEYLLATHGADEDKVAKREYMRAMGYSPSPELVFTGFGRNGSETSSEEEDDDDSSSSDSDSDSDDSDESDKGKKSKKKSKSKASKGSKKSSKKSKSSEKDKSEKKVKDKKKEDTESD